MVLESEERQLTDLDIKSIWASTNPLNKRKKCLKTKAEKPYNQDFSL